MNRLAGLNIEQQARERFPNLLRAFDPLHSNFGWSCKVCNSAITCPHDLTEIVEFASKHVHNEPTETELAEHYVEMAAR